MTTNDNDILVQQANRFGGLLDTTTLDETARKLLDEGPAFAQSYFKGVREHMESAWRVRPLIIRWTCSPQINACAFRTDTTDYILITVEVAEKLLGTMGGLLSCPECLVRVGDASQEESVNGTLRNGFPRWPLSVRPAKDLPTGCFVPNNRVRTAYALHLAALAIEFICLHEVGHILGGHLEAIQTQGMMPSIVELESTCSPRSSLRQSMEIDADFHAAHVGSFVILHPELHENLHHTFQWRNCSPLEAACWTYALAVGVLFRLFDSDGPPPENNGRVHPHPAVRSNCVSSKGFSLAMQAGMLRPYSIDAVKQYVGAPLRHLEEMWRRFDLPGRRLGSNVDWSQAVVHETQRVSEQYFADQTTLRAYARIPPRWYGQWPT